MTIMKLTTRKRRALECVLNKDWKGYKKIPLSIRMDLEFDGLTTSSLVTGEIQITDSGREALRQTKEAH